MEKLIPVVVGACSGCCCCLMTCPVGAAGPINPKKVDAEKCISCGKCVVACPSKGREMQKASA